MKRVLVGLLMLSASSGNIGLGQEDTTPRYTPFEIAIAFASCRQLRTDAAENERRFPIQQFERNVVAEQDVLAGLEKCVLETLEGRRVELVPLD